MAFEDLSRHHPSTEVSLQRGEALDPVQFPFDASPEHTNKTLLEKKLK